MMFSEDEPKHAPLASESVALGMLIFRGLPALRFARRVQPLQLLMFRLVRKQSFIGIIVGCYNPYSGL